MMENYEDIRLEHVKSKEICTVNEMSIERDTDFLNFGGQAQNLNFGAEILSTNFKMPSTMATAVAEATSSKNEEATSEQQWKTNDEIKTKTLVSMEEQQGEEEANVQSVAKITTNVQLSTDEEDDGEESGDSSSDTDCSEVSGLSEISGREWKPATPFHVKWVQKQIHSGRDPRDLLSMVLPNGTTDLGPGTNDMMLWHMLSSMLSPSNENEPKRRKLRDVNTFENVLQLVQSSQRIIVLTGAGVSVSCGIPDFRSSNGIYSRLARDFPDLPDPQAMFDINYFSRDPRPFYKFAREIYPGQFKPSPGHRFIKMLESKGKLLRNYTQNIDTLEQVAGIRRVIECHGSFSTASCTKCKFKCNADDIRADIFAQRIPVCPRCQPNKEHSIEASVAVTELELRQLVENGIMKPDIVFFGEGLPDEFHNVMATDKDECDLLIVMGSSLKVRPVNYIPNSIPVSVPQILINREKLHHLEFDVELLGDSDVIINQLCHCLGDDWQQICYDDNFLKESKELLPLECEQMQLHQDTDTQSIKSNASTDYLLSSAGACSDSGFESSTFSSVNIRRATIASLNASEAIEKIKTDILVDFNEGEQQKQTNKGSTNMILELLDENPIEEALKSGQLSATHYQAGTHRHLSIDSSKDSGIEHCDTSNPALPNQEPHLPPLDNFGASGGTQYYTIGVDAPSAHCSTVETAATSATPTHTVPYKIKEPQTPPQKRRSAAERLAPGTFYCFGNNRSYVFPGAQVFLDNDFDDDVNEIEDDSDDEREDETYDEDEDDINGTALSPLMPPSVEAHMVTEITKSTTLQSPNKKRRSSASLDCSHSNATANFYADAAYALAAACQNTSTTSSSSSSNSSYSNISTLSYSVEEAIAEAAALGEMATTTTTKSAIICSPPPSKKRRPSLEKAIGDYLPILDDTPTT